MQSNFLWVYRSGKAAFRKTQYKESIGTEMKTAGGPSDKGAQLICETIVPMPLNTKWAYKAESKIAMHFFWNRMPSFIQASYLKYIYRENHSKEAARKDAFVRYEQ